MSHCYQFSKEICILDEKQRIFKITNFIEYNDVNEVHETQCLKNSPYKSNTNLKIYKTSESWQNGRI